VVEVVLKRCVFASTALNRVTEVALVSFSLLLCLEAYCIPCTLQLQKGHGQLDGGLLYAFRVHIGSPMLGFALMSSLPAFRPPLQSANCFSHAFSSPRRSTALVSSSAMATCMLGVAQSVLVVGGGVRAWRGWTGC